MTQNLKLGYAMARVMGFTGIGCQGAYYARDRLYLPPKGYCMYVLRQARAPKLEGVSGTQIIKA